LLFSRSRVSNYYEDSNAGGFSTSDGSHIPIVKRTYTPGRIDFDLQACGTVFYLVGDITQNTTGFSTT
jgi:hypothetical protein